MMTAAVRDTAAEHGRQCRATWLGRCAADVAVQLGQAPPDLLLLLRIGVVAQGERLQPGRPSRGAVVHRIGGVAEAQPGADHVHPMADRLGQVPGRSPVSRMG